MPLIIPQLDDRDYRQILSDLVARIPVHNPEWSNFNDSDPGITLLQLFAFMGENLLFRSNLIPERNRLKFIQLLGVPLQPATAATGMVTLANERGPLEAITLSPGVRVQAGPVGFMTANGLDVLPVEARIYYRRALSTQEATQADTVYKQLFSSFTDDQTDTEYYETVPMPAPVAGAMPVVDLNADTVDRSLWIALLRRQTDKVDAATVLAALDGKTLSLGIMPFVESATKLLRPSGTVAAPTTSPLTAEIGTGKLSGDQPQYRKLDQRADDDPTQNLTLVQLSLPSKDSMGAWPDLDPLEEGVGEYPPSLEDDAVKQRVVTWIRIRFDGGADVSTGTATPVQARISWMGINASRVAQRVQAPAERLPDGTGEPDQTVTLANRPVIPGSVALLVGGDLWTPTDDLLAAPAEVPVTTDGEDSTQPQGNPRVFVIDPESGSITFGNGLQGARPPSGAPIVASYAYGGGRAGNVGIGAIKTSPDLPPGLTVINPLPLRNGTDGQSVDDAERLIPRYLRHRDRAVSADDFKDIVASTPGIELGRVEVLPLYQPQAGTQARGVVTVLVIPFDVRRPEAPEPDRFFIDAVCRQLDPRRLVTTEVYVYGPSYIGLSISVGIDVVAGRDVAPVRELVKATIRAWLSPLVGGPDGTGWPLQKAVEDRDVFAVATRVDGVSRVRQVLMWDQTGSPIPTLPISGLTLPRLDRVQVTAGDAEDLTTVTPTTTPQKKRLPVPVLRAEC
jgi:predicted phage baseplate assembly protein